MSRNQSKMNKEKQIFENQISLILREDKTLEIYVGDSLAAEISDGRLDMEFAKEILEGLDYEINESSFTIRPLHTDEQKYTYKQSTQIEGQTGNIGYLRGDFGAGGKEFFSSWFDHRRDLKTDEFKSELDEVINALRSEEYGLLKSRTAMAQYAGKYPDSAFQGNYATEYGFRTDTEKYSFLIRCNPARGDYNFYCYCYVREWLDRHMEKASRGIRFITPDYKEKFIIPDGDKIRIALSDGEQLDRTCRYINENYLEVGSNLYHICEFAERMEQNGNTVIPLRSSLPEKCYVFVQTENCVGIVKKGESGFFRTDIQGGKPSETNALVNDMNEKLGLTKDQTEAMKAGSMFGWDTPAADPKSYDKSGIPVKPKQKDYER